ncbi:diguanylate cyclase [bacterium]|nr:diguanylate cyclase [bacterium]
MPVPQDEFDLDIALHTLSFATRQIATVMDLDRFTYIALETMLDFGRSHRALLIAIDDDRQHATVLGDYHDGHFEQPDLLFQMHGSEFEEHLAMKRGRELEHLAIPDYGDVPRDMEKDVCVLVPLLGQDSRVIGWIVLEVRKGNGVTFAEWQILPVISTIISVAYQNARHFRMATVDSLTRLFVRRYFDLRLREEIARIRRHGGSMALMMIDIDHFKHFNDTYGHQQGDIVLAELAKLIKTTIRQDVDIACRYGGEEFAIIMPNTDLDGAMVLAERVRKATERHEFPGQDEPLFVTLSGGVAALTDDDSLEPNELLEHADEMLYVSKKNGRNRITAWKE